MRLFEFRDALQPQSNNVVVSIDSTCMRLFRSSVHVGMIALVLQCMKIFNYESPNGIRTNFDTLDAVTVFEVRTSRRSNG